MLKYGVNDKLTMRKTVGDAPSEDGPGGVCAREGDIVIVRRLRDSQFGYPYAVSHPDRTDGRTFGVDESEVDLFEKAAPEPAGEAAPH